MDIWRARWGVNQWAAFFEHKALPVMDRTRQRLIRLETDKRELLSPKELADLALTDPLLCLRFLREAERCKSQRLQRETTTALAAILQLGIDQCRHHLLSAQTVEECHADLLAAETRAARAAQLAQTWAQGGLVINPDEIAVATLLADTGELLLWLHEPQWTEAAELNVRQLTSRCLEIWNLPAPLRLLLRGTGTRRSQLVRLCSDTARHLAQPAENPLPTLAIDLVAANELVPSVTLDWLVESLTELPEADRPILLELAREEQARSRVKAS